MISTDQGRANTTAFAILFFLLAATETMAQGPSIWANHVEERAFLFQDTRARHVGDLVTVIIAQATDVDSRENHRMNKSSSTGTDFDLEAETGGKLGSRAANAAFDFGSSSGREFGGGTDYTSEQGFTDRMSATIVDVTPAGNFMIEGHRHVVIEGERRTLCLTGVIRPIDLSPQNSVQSRYIADFQLFYKGTGPGKAFSRQGWFSRGINRIWPF